MSANGYGPKIGTCLVRSDNLSDRLIIKKFGKHLQIQRRINFEIGS